MKTIILSTLTISGVFYILGQKFGWSVFHYDEIRLILILATLLASFNIIINHQNLTSKEIIVNFTIFFITVFFAFRNIYSIYDFISIFSLFVLIYFLKINFKFEKINHIWVGLIYFSFFPLFLINFSVYDFIIKGIWFDWQLNGGSIRILDSILVCLFFMSFYLKSINDYYIGRVYYIYIFYLFFALFFDGARSALLSIILPMIILFIYKEYRGLVYKNLLTLTISFTLYYVIKLIKKLKFKNLMDLKSETIFIKNNSSGRLDIWTKMYENFLESPFWGLGGGYLSNMPINVNHAHSLYIRLLFEWGFLGFLILILILIYLLGIYGKINKILFFGCVSVLIDAAFSGNLIYAPSQLFIIIFIGLSLSTSNKALEYNKKGILFSRVIFFIWFFLYFYIFIFFLFDDFFCWGCGSFKGIEAPAFWYYGSADNLVDGSKIP